MAGRAGTVCCLLLLAVLTVLPGREAAAAGVPLRGQQILTPAWHFGTTGECLCDTQWYTVRLQPGTVTVYADLITISMNMGPTYSLMVWMNQGDTIVGFDKKTCARSKKPCNAPLSIKVKVRRAGVYYLKLKGLGGEGITYALQVHGGIGARRCTRTC